MTDQADEKDLDIVTAVKPVSAEAAKPGQYLGVIREYIHPVPAGLQVELLAYEDGPGGCLVIHVPRQHPDSGPHLICQVVEDGVTLKQIVAGFVVRKGDRNTPLSPKALQHRFRKGSDTVSVRLGRIEDKLDTALDQGEAPPPDAKPDSGELKRRISDILEAGE